MTLSPRVINADNRLKKADGANALTSSSAPEKAGQEAVDAVRQRDAAGAFLRGPNNAPHDIALTTPLQGSRAVSARTCRQARRYSDAPVIVDRPSSSCTSGLPKKKGAEVQALIYHRLGPGANAPTITQAKEMVESRSPCLDISIDVIRAPGVLNTRPR